MSTWFFVLMGFLLGWISSAMWDFFLDCREDWRKDDVHKG
jgi:hypothetical protein